MNSEAGHFLNACLIIVIITGKGSAGQLLGLDRPPPRRHDDEDLLHLEENYLFQATSHDFHALNAHCCAKQAVDSLVDHPDLSVRPP
eukprot:CAMPEP_0194743352 /NCGR_PEP_ID=MMETSP0296-20130528/100263_1 /TAXON_ID=39354 /ORGANISM="Heterosigma akashiwo, Strain CCMP2393" /LENGTH=86 /DNA_ID=CAMNT_0039655369 /DNA_START=602 /DNA_END=862 /DNA_ORIENTATION=-